MFHDHAQVRLHPPPPPLEAGLAWPLPGCLHEIHAPAEAFATALAFAFAQVKGGCGPILLVRAPRRAALRMQLHGEGLTALGIDPGQLLIVETRDEAALLQAALDAARCPGLMGVVLESWGALPRYDLTASRRLVLAAERSGTPVVVLRGDAVPRASAAHSRWIIRSAPSLPLAAQAPGLPACAAELSRRRGGPDGLHWRLEWNDGEHLDAERGLDHGDATPVPGAVVSLVSLRADAQGGGAERLPALGTAGAGSADPQCAATGGGGFAGLAAGAVTGDDAGRRAGALPRTGELAA